MSTKFLLLSLTAAASVLLIGTAGCDVGTEVTDDTIESEQGEGEDVAYCEYRLCGYDCRHEDFSSGEWYCCRENDSTCSYYLSRFLECHIIDRQDGHNGGNDCPGGGDGGGGGGGGGGGNDGHGDGWCDDDWGCAPGETCSDNRCAPVGDS